MRNYTLSREQSQALDIIKDHDLSVILYLDKLNLSTTLLHSLKNSLKEKKRSILFLESPDLISAIKEKVNKSSLGHLFLFLENDDYIKTHDLAKIRAMAKEKMEEATPIEDIIPQLSNKEKRIAKVFSDQAEKIFGDRRWRDLVMLPRRTEKVLNTLKFQFDLELNQQEFWHIRGQIEEAKALYDTGHLINERIASAFGISLDNEEKIRNLRIQLVEIKERLEAIIQMLDIELYNYRNRIHRKLEEEYINVSNIIDEISLLHNKISNDQNKAHKSPFTFFGNKVNEKDQYLKKFNQLKKQLNESILIHFSSETQSENSDDIYQDLQRWHSQLNDWKSNRDNITSKMIKSLNKNNSDTGNFKDIDRDLSNLFHEINELKIFKENLENTGLNTYSQYLSADKCLSHIKLCLSYLNENKEIIIWESFYGNLPHNIQQLIQALKKYDIKEWIPLFEKWYLDRLLEKHFNPDSGIINQLLEEYNQLSNDYENLLGKSIDLLFSQSRLTTLESCKNRNKDIHQKLLKKKNVDGLRAFDLIWNEKEMLSNFFPVMVVSTKLLRSNRLLKDGNWDQIYCERTEIFTHIEKFTLLEQKICFLSPLSESFKICNDLNIKLNDKKQMCKLLIHEYNFNKPISELSLSDRLRAAKKLSKILLSLNQQVRIFQMRNANIISLLPQYLNQQMVEYYDESGIKEIVVEDSLYETVTESIIGVERDQFLMYQDNLLSFDHVENFNWQIKAINSFRNSGIRNLNVNTLEFRNTEDYFSTLLEKAIPCRKEEDVTLPKEA